MRAMPKFLGVVAAGFLALGMGAGVAGAGQMPTPHPTHDVSGISQVGSNSNDTYQKARSQAETNQKNVNKPFSFFTVGSNDGNVQQWNKAETESAAVNRNGTSQNLGQGQQVTSPPNKPSNRGCDNKGEKRHHKNRKHDKDGFNKGNNDRSPSSYDPRGNGHPSQSGDVSQRGSNDNSTKQHASSSAETNQVNVNAPISAFSVGSNDGNVNQGNQAETESYAYNQNGTSQNAGQGQSVSRNDGKDGKRDNGDVSQSGRNSNSTDQSAKSQAETNQKNINVPISLFSVGSNDGSVQQGNSANTNSAAANSNGTSQGLGQAQLVGGLLG